MKAPVLLLIDASIYLFRAFFALPPRWQAEDGGSTHAVLGFTRAVKEAVAQVAPSHVAVAFDTSLTTCFRNRLFPDYKANRPPADPDILRQQRLCQESCAALGLHWVADPELEADDLLASLHRQWREVHVDAPAFFMTRDKDYGQLLLDPHTQLWDDGKATSPREFAVRFGVPPRSFPDYQALVGDAVDNVPGVRGVGAKTAAVLIARYGTLELVYANLSAIGAGVTSIRRPAQVAKDLASQRDQAFAMRDIVRLRRDAQVVTDLAQLLPRDVPAATSAAFFARQGLARALGLER